MVSKQTEEQFLIFDNEQDGLQKSVSTLTPTKAHSHPYTDAPAIPRDILEYLPPSGERFSLFGDPYAKLVFIKQDRNSIRRSYYWVDERNRENNFTDQEIALLSFLSKHRCATGKQLNAVIKPTNLKKFLLKSVTKGIIVPFTWKSPCPLDRTKPRMYGLTPAAANLAEQLFNLPYQLPRNYKFLPIQFEGAEHPGIHDIFNFIIANEFYCHLKSLDRVLDWYVNKQILLNNGTNFRPQFIANVIKDKQDYKTFWIEVIRPVENWYHNAIKRFQSITKALDNIEDHNRPERLIIIVDDDSRIPDLANLAHEFMPNIVLRFTSDARLLNDWNEQSLVMYDDLNKQIVGARIPFLSPDFKGMTASEYYKSFEEETVDQLIDEELEDF